MTTSPVAQGSPEEGVDVVVLPNRFPQVPTNISVNSQSGSTYPNEVEEDCHPAATGELRRAASTLLPSMIMKAGRDNCPVVEPAPQCHSDVNMFPLAGAVKEEAETITVKVKVRTPKDSLLHSTS